MKKIATLVLVFMINASIGLPCLTNAYAQEAPVQIEVLERKDCTHCKAERAFLEALMESREDIKVIFYDLANEENKQLWEDIAETEGLPKVTPITLIGDAIIQGFDKPETTGVMFEQLIEQKKGKEQLSFAQILERGGTGNAHEIEGAGCDEDTGACAAEAYVPMLVDIPLIGTIDVKRYSLPTLSVILGFIDGFNPCAMWVLVTFLLILVQVGDRKRMWQIAGLFILAEAVMYYLILNVWYTVWDFVGLDNIVTPIVGLIAIGAGLSVGIAAISAIGQAAI